MWAKHFYVVVMIIVSKINYFELNTAWKVSVFGIILVRNFPHSDRISPYWVRMRENEDQNNSEYGHFLHRESHWLV